MRTMAKQAPIVVLILLLIVVGIRIGKSVSAYLFPTMIPLEYESEIIGFFRADRTTIFFDNECITFDWEINPNVNPTGVYVQWTEVTQTSQTVCPLVQDLPLTWPIEVQFEGGNVFTIMDIHLDVYALNYIFTLIALVIGLLIFIFVSRQRNPEDTFRVILKRLVNHHSVLIILSILTVIIYTEICQSVLFDKRTTIYSHAIAVYNQANDLDMVYTLHELPHQGYFNLLSILRKLGIPYFQGTTLVLTVATLLTFWVIVAVLRSQLDNKVNDNLIIVLALISMWVGAIHIPLEGFLVYFGQGSPNVHHNSTLILMKPLIILVFFCFMATIDTPSYRKDIFASICMALSTYIKPSFGLVFFPVIGLYILYKYKHHYFKRNLISMTILVVPTILILLNQYFGYYGDEEAVRSIGIRILDVWQRWSPNVPISILAALAFPIVMLAYRPEKSDFREYFYIAWCVTLLGIIQFIFIAEVYSSGDTLYSGNWMNGYLNGMMILYVIAFVGYIRLLDAYFKKSLQQPILFWICTLVLLLHLHGGIHYVRLWLFQI